MKDYSELLKRLDFERRCLRNPDAPIFHEAFEAIKQLQAEVEKLRGVRFKSLDSQHTEENER